LDGVVARLYGRPDVSVSETSGIEYGSGSEEPPVYPAGSAFRCPVGPLGTETQLEINSSTTTAISERAAVFIYPGSSIWAHLSGLIYLASSIRGRF
jgi:hypothetical protein